MDASSKYNRSTSIPIDSIPKEEITKAIEEWCEGNEHLKRLLWSCYNKGIKTDGCCGDVAYYIEFSYPNSDKLGSLFDAMYSIPDSEVLISVDGGNIFSTLEWDKSSIGFGVNHKVGTTERASVGNNIFDRLNDTVNNTEDKEQNIDNSILNLISYLKDKETGIMMRFSNTGNNNYSFEIDMPKTNGRLYDQLNGILTGIGVNKEDIEAPHHIWSINTNNLSDIKSKVDTISERIVNDFKIEPLTLEEANKIHEYDEQMPHFWVSNLYAHYMKRTLPENEYLEWYNRQIQLHKLDEEKMKIEEEKYLATLNVENTGMTK